MNFDFIKDWVLEALRLAAIAALSAVINYVLSLLSSGAIPLSPELTGIIGALLKGLDRAIHESKNIKMKGIVPF